MQDILCVLRTLTQIFDAQEISCMLSGSVASSAYGIIRSTNDVDIVAEIREEHIAALAAALKGAYYVNADSIRTAIHAAASFSVIHLETMTKADIFIRQNSAWADAQWSRRRMEQIGVAASIAIPVISPEDMILQKLDWFRMKSGFSDQQWGDITGMLKVQQPTLDYAYLKEWAANLSLTELLAQAYDDSGIEETP